MIDAKHLFVPLGSLYKLLNEQSLKPQEEFNDIAKIPCANAVTLGCYEVVT